MKKLGFFLTILIIALFLKAQDNYKDVTSNYKVYKEGETVSVITDYHKTGGMPNAGVDLQAGSVTGVFGIGGHTAVKVPAFDYGLGSEKFVGIYENTAIFEKTMSLLFSKNGHNHPYFFIQVTDPQFGMFENNNGFEKETYLYEKSVKEINRLKPDFVVITGDFVNDPKDMSQIAEFKRITVKIDSKIPVYYTPGNHDIGKIPDYLSINSYIKNYGYDKFAFKHKNSQFIGFNSCIIKANTPDFEQRQYDWLKKMLAKSKKARHIIIFCHYQFFVKSFDEPETYSNIGILNREKYLTLFDANKVKVVFSGHLHNNAYAKFGEMELVTTSAVGKPMAKAPSGFRIVKVYSDRIESVYYGLDEIPESITFDQK
ncbi:MAG: metallophosphoesterase [Bacteroidota bacterium]